MWAMLAGMGEDNGNGRDADGKDATLTGMGEEDGMGHFMPTQPRQCWVTTSSKLSSIFAIVV
jgi:hypothetical protein